VVLFIKLRRLLFQQFENQEQAEENRAQRQADSPKQIGGKSDHQTGQRDDEQEFCCDPHNIISRFAFFLQITMPGSAVGGPPFLAKSATNFALDVSIRIE